MAEFCKQCFEELFSKENEELILSEDDDLCEGCGQFKPVVIEIKKK